MKRSPIDIGEKARERGSTFANRGSGLKRSQRPRRSRAVSEASTLQRRKAARARFCDGCGRERQDFLTLDPAHLTPRSKGGCDSVKCTIVLCRDGAGDGCHREFDEGRLDLLKILTREHVAYLEELQHMLEHLAPVELVEQLANARVAWREAA